MKRSSELPRTAAQRERLVADVMKHLQQLDYAAGSLVRLRGMFGSFLRFACRSRRPLDQLAEDFLERAKAGWKRSPPFTPAQQHRRTTMKILLDFAASGRVTIQRPPKQDTITLAAPLYDIVVEFEDFCREHVRIRDSNTRSKCRAVLRLLMFAESLGLQKISDLDGAVISKFVSTHQVKKATMAALLSDLRSFLRFLCVRGFLEADLSHEVPRVRIRPDDKIRSVWSEEEVAGVLGAIDRTTPGGRRDYAIILLAARLGLRPSDIRSLTLDEIRWDEMLIEKTQVKTGQHLTLPFSAEVGEAIIDYLQNGRPRVARRELFMRMLAPYEPIRSNFQKMIEKYQKRAGVVFTPGAERGFRSLRHTVATQLLKADTKLETISAVLGHVSPETTRLYTKIDIEALRSAALDADALGAGHE
jgi:integrase